MPTEAEWVELKAQYQKWVEEENARKALLPKEYQVVYLDETKKLCQLDNIPVIAETNSLSEACEIMHHIWDTEDAEVAVWQPRTRGFRQYIKRKILPARDAKGRFIKVN